MEFLILGPLEVRDERGVIALAGQKPRAVLAVLLLNANEPVSAERLATALWGEEAPAGSSKTVQVYVSRLRKALGDPEIIGTTPAGYCLRVAPGELDVARFEQLVEEGRRLLATGQSERAATMLREGLAMWRGPPLADLAFEPFADAEIARLEEQRQSALEARVDADLSGGRHLALVGELHRLVALHPTRERLAGQLMLALYRCGRQAEALEAYRDARTRLVAEAGIEPGPELRRLHEAILRQDESLEAPTAATELPDELDATGLPPLAGREAELASLRECWEAARNGAAVLVTLTGGPGIGKSRLASELAGEVHQAGAGVLYATGAARADAVRAVVRRARELTRPALLVVDDADRVDDDVQAELAALTRDADGHSLLVLASADDVAALAGVPADAALELRALDAEAVGAIAVSYALRDGDATPPAAWLHEASDGVPQRVHDIAREWTRHEAARRVGAVAERTAARRAELRSMEAELAGGVVDLQTAREPVDPHGAGPARVVCPFKGLASFDVDDADYFFGRERLVAELVARLVGSPLLGITGPSGSGKSSVLRAGLLPALAAGVLPGSGDWQQVLMRPGEHPLDELNRAGSGVADDGHVLLAIDQFEETFTACGSERERTAFISSLVHAARDTRGRCTVVLVVRADAYERCAEYPELSGPLAANQVLVTPMQRSELRQAVEGPARRVGLRVEPELVDAIVADVEGEPGALPLLSAALLELWQHRDGRQLRHAAYEHSGGVRGAVARLAEEAYGRLDGPQRGVARSVLVRLAAEGAGGALERRRVPLAELETERSDDVAQVLALFTDRRLVTVSAGSVEVAHEALLREWPRLRGWIDADRKGLRIHRAVTAAAQEWRELARDDGALFRGSRLDEAVEWREAEDPVLNQLEQEFLDASEAHRRTERAARRRRIRFAFAGLLSALAAITAVAIVALYQGREAERQRDIAVSQRLAATATNALDADPAVSLSLALRAMDAAPTREAVAALRQATLQSRAMAVLRGHRGRVMSASFSPDGEQAVSSGVDGTVRVWDLGRERLLQTIGGEDRAVNRAVFSPDGRQIATVADDGTVAVMDTAGRDRRVVMRARGVRLFALDISSDGRRLAVGGGDGRVYLVRTDGEGTARVLGAHRAPLTTIAISSDMSRIVSGDLAGWLHVWDVASGQSRSTFAHRDGVMRAAFSRDGSAVISGGQDNRVRIEDAATGVETAVLKEDGVVFAAAMSPDGRSVVAGGPNGTVRIWDVASRVELAALRGHRDDVIDAGFSPTGDRVISGGEDGTVRVWRSPDQRVLPAVAQVYGSASSSDGSRLVTWGGGGVEVRDASSGALVTRLGTGHGTATAADISPDGQRVIAAADDHAVRVWRATGGRPVTTLRGHRQQVNGAAFSPDGSRAVTAGEDHRVIVWSLAERRPVATMDHGDRVAAVDFGPDGRHVLSAGADGTVRIWRADRTAPPVIVLERDRQELNAAAFSADGRRVVAGADDGTIRIWSADGGEAAVLRRHVGQVTAVAFDSDGSRIASGGGDDAVRVWNPRTGESLAVLAAHPGADVVSVAFTPDGRDVLSAGIDDTVRVSRCEVCGSVQETLALARSRLVR